MATIPSRRSQQSAIPPEQMLYDHLLHWIELESPAEITARFRSLFIDGLGYAEPEILQALKQVITADDAAENYRFVLNRCCHILINRWQGRLQSQLAIPALIDLFEQQPATPVASAAAYSSTVRRLRHLNRQFTETEQYVTLQRLSQVLNETTIAPQVDSKPLGGLIRRYPYLYEHCLLSEDSSSEQEHTVRQVQATVQRQFELNLSQYMIYQVRRSQQVITRSVPSKLDIFPVNNPTLLNEQELSQAIRHYVGKVDGMRTYKDLAHNFRSQLQQPPTFAAFKHDLYDYITAAVDPSYGNRKFNAQLASHLERTLPEGNSHQLNDFLLVRTCTQVLNFLVTDRSHHPNHFVFLDLINNLGPIITTGLLLKIVLLCRRVKPALERRFSILFSHYESSSREAVIWLIQALENLNIALSTNFGAVTPLFIR